MATFAGIAATSKAILGLLERAAAEEPEFAPAVFSIFTSADLQRPPGERLGVSLYLYHVAVNPSRRGAPGRVDASGVRRSAPLPLDLRYLLTAWAKDAATQQRLLGWCVRVLQDTPTLPTGVLNSHEPHEVFLPGETVDLVWENLSQQDVFDIWEVARANQQPSAAYLARTVELDSVVEADGHALVQTTDFRYATVGGR
ncbi:DUF4255 domain-containing protein [Streptomyces virginiae]|uniref:DUF4255 domain-containing protein n=1 Tax=Streptomyces virginiae TaxID=1961 RepID=UPI0036C02AAE